MRIGPFIFFHDSRHRDGLFAIEHGEGMMGQSGGRDRHREPCQNQSSEIHCDLLVHGAFGTGNLAACAPRRLPSGSVAATSSPPREPSFRGWNSTDTLSPGLTLSTRQPPVVAWATACISNDHSPGLPVEWGARM